MMFSVYLCRVYRFRTQNSEVMISGHCTCMAGIAETCTQLFKLEAVFGCREIIRVTSQTAYWIILSNITKVGAEAGPRIDYTSAKAKRKCLNRILDGEVVSMLTLKINSCKFGIATQGHLLYN